MCYVVILVILAECGRRNSKCEDFVLGNQQDNKFSQGVPVVMCYSWMTITYGVELYTYPSIVPAGSGTITLLQSPTSEPTGKKSKYS